MCDPNCIKLCLILMSCALIAIDLTITCVCITQAKKAAVKKKRQPRRRRKSDGNLRIHHPQSPPSLSSLVTRSLSHSFIRLLAVARLDAASCCPRHADVHDHLRDCQKGRKMVYGWVGVRVHGGMEKVIERWGGINVIICINTSNLVALISMCICEARDDSESAGQSIQQERQTQGDVVGIVILEHISRSQLRTVHPGGGHNTSNTSYS